MIAEYWPPPAAAGAARAILPVSIEAVVVRSIAFLPRLARLTVDFAALVAAAFCTFAGAFLIFGVLLPALVVVGAAAKPLSARRLKGAPFAGLKAKLITPAATAAATTVNFC